MSSEDRQEHMLSAPMLNFSIEKALEQLKSETQWKNENKNSITLVKNDDLCIILMAFKKGAIFPKHSTTSAITFMVISGSIKFTAATISQELKAQDLITLEKEIPHEVEALEESAALLTMIYS